MRRVPGGPGAEERVKAMFRLTRREQIAVIVVLGLALGGWAVRWWRAGAGEPETAEEKAGVGE